jgi:hypothetical protein
LQAQDKESYADGDDNVEGSGDNVEGSDEDSQNDDLSSSVYGSYDYDD